jgi:prophage regulatory protein
MQDTEKLLRINRVLEITSLGRTRLREMVRDNKFPGPVATGARSRAWRLSEVAEWMDSCKPAPKWQQGVKAAKAAHAKRATLDAHT